MRHALTELQRFFRAALVVPVTRDHTESDRAFKRRRLIAVVTLVVGLVLNAWALRIPPGDGLFYIATFALAAVWAGGAFLSGPLHLGRAHTRSGSERSRSVVQSLVLGLLLLALFLVGALVVARIPVLREPVDGLLDHARFGSLPVVAVITAVNGVAEELFYRGALFAAVGRRHAVLVTTIVYAVVCAAAGVPLLVLAAVLVGIVVGLQRRVTGGILGPIVTHLTWSLGMLFLLPHVLAAAA
ncbi:probable integral membrane protein [Janibacter sp. HTCC2649]|uniref:CPBP family intramembrane glutamic endopeptidase n=1 Tax=Janibacter sp. HTCC2649 TaxID=313589 RepID=UPI0000671816|nr:CPBP family intramembrane glutamic endopeptidase [Janibacter sp. HTCC2649]EAP98507.1 probable integral membrane protein [Janibacter sp. HTCC2649]